MSKRIALVLAAGLVASAVVALSSTASLAQMQGTEQEQAACRPDVFKYCKPLLSANAGPNAPPNTFSILACLKDARAKLSKACLAVLVSHGQ
jgi:hypothetical protein